MHHQNSNRHCYCKFRWSFKYWKIRFLFFSMFYWEVMWKLLFFFPEEEVSGAALLALNDRMIQQLVKKIGHQAVLLDFIKKYKQSNQWPKPTGGPRETSPLTLAQATSEWVHGWTGLVFVPRFCTALPCGKQSKLFQNCGRFQLDGVHSVFTIWLTLMKNWVRICCVSFHWSLNTDWGC